jgi:hypothetical protein
VGDRVVLMEKVILNRHGGSGALREDCSGQPQYVSKALHQGVPRTAETNGAGVSATVVQGQETGVLWPLETLRRTVAVFLHEMEGPEGE